MGGRNRQLLLVALVLAACTLGAQAQQRRHRDVRRRATPAPSPQRAAPAEPQRRRLQQTQPTAAATAAAARPNSYSDEDEYYYYTAPAFTQDMRAAPVVRQRAQPQHSQQPAAAMKRGRADDEAPAKLQRRDADELRSEPSAAHTEEARPSADSYRHSSSGKPAPEERPVTQYTKQRPRPPPHVQHEPEHPAQQEPHEGYSRHSYPREQDDAPKGYRQRAGDNDSAKPKHQEEPKGEPHGESHPQKKRRDAPDEYRRPEERKYKRRPPPGKPYVPKQPVAVQQTKPDQPQEPTVMQPVAAEERKPEPDQPKPEQASASQPVAAEERKPEAEPKPEQASVSQPVAAEERKPEQPKPEQASASEPVAARAAYNRRTSKKRKGKQPGEEDVDGYTKKPSEEKPSAQHQPDAVKEPTPDSSSYGSGASSDPKPPPPPGYTKQPEEQPTSQPADTPGKSVTLLELFKSDCVDASSDGRNYFRSAVRCAKEEKPAGSCTWELAPFAEPVPVNDFTVQTATAHGTCRFDKGSKHCSAPLGPGVTLSIQVDVYRVKVITQAPLEGTAHGSCEAGGKFGSGYAAAHLQSGVRAVGSDAAEQLYVSWADTFVGEITAIKSGGKKKGGHHGPEPDAGANGVVQYVASLTAPVPIEGRAKEHAELPFMRLGEYYFEFPAEEGLQY